MTNFPDAPLNTKHPDVFYRFGAISLQWNQIDYRLEILLKSYFFGLDEGEEIVARMSNGQRAELLDMFLRKRERGDWLKYVLYIMKGINVCRENRNFLVHGIVHNMGDDYIELERFTRKLKQKKRVTVKLSHLKEVERALMIYGAHLDVLMFRCEPFSSILGKQHTTLPEKPPLPDKLEGTLPEVLIDESSPPQP